ncbi:MAG TPA: septum formation initiator family protein [Candidatus Eisenbacteria bacterium]
MNRTSLNEQVTNRYQRIFHDGYDNAAQHWKKGLALLLVTVTGLCAWELVAGNQGILARKRVKADIARLIAANADLARQQKDYAAQNRGLATNDFMAEKAAREILHRARPGEIIYLFEESAAGGTPMTFSDVTIVQAPPAKADKEKPATR